VSGETDRVPRPPRWAGNSVSEDGGVTHELVSDLHPRGFGWIPEAPRDPRETDVSLSVIDWRGPDGWVRTEPTVQVEGGSFTIAEALRLRQALDDLLSRVDAA
jgi:hypothetical protein